MAVAKFTIDQFDAYFTAQNAAPDKLARQLLSLRQRYNVLNDAYAEQLKSLDTEAIRSRDEEGDQLVLGIKGVLEAAVRMTFDQERLAKSKVLWETFKKYRIDTRENYISEWSKIQQFCEEYAAKAPLQETAAMLGIDPAVQRLTVLADEIRQLMTERNAAAPEQGAMAAAREALYPEYRTLILLLNSFAAVNDDVAAYKPLIRALNDNLNYVRKHAMAHGAGAVNVGEDSASGSAEGDASGDSGTSGNDSGAGSGSSGTSGSDSGAGSGNTGTGGNDSGAGSGNTGGSGNSGGGSSDPDNGDGME